MTAQLCKYSNFASEFLGALDYHFHCKHRIQPPKNGHKRKYKMIALKRKKKHLTLPNFLKSSDLRPKETKGRPWPWSGLKGCQGVGKTLPSQ